MALKHVLDDSVAAAKQVRLDRRRLEHVGHAWRGRLLVQPRDVPHAHRLVERRGDHEVLLGVKARAHDIVVVASQHRDARARLPVPDADGLVIRRRDNPRRLHMELDRANVVEMSEEREEAAAQLVVPYCCVHPEGGKGGGNGARTAYKMRGMNRQI
eukprot:356656-Chlamydomonas_euryale.AAC.5